MRTRTRSTLTALVAAAALLAGLTGAGATAADAATAKHFSAAPTPTVTGTTRVGRVLTAHIGTWKPAPAKRVYQWKRDGAKITGATKTTYAVTSADLGHALTLTASAAKKGYATTSRTSAATPRIIRGVDARAVLSIVAGKARAVHNGPASQSAIWPADVAVDASGNTIVADSRTIDRIAPDGTLTILAGNGTTTPVKPGAARATGLGNGPQSIAVDSTGTIYFAGPDATHVYALSPAGGISVFAGNGDVNGGPLVPGPALSSPLSPHALAVGPSDELYVADTSWDSVVKITKSGTLSVVAGDGTFGDVTPGSALSSDLSPTSLAVDAAGDLFIGTFSDHVVAKVTPAGDLSVVAGDGSFSAPTPGSALATGLGEVAGIGVDSAGDLYVGDSFTSRLSKVTSAGQLSIVAGTGTYGEPKTGPASASPIGYIQRIAASPTTGDLVLADTGFGSIEKISPSGSLSVVADSGTGTPTPGPATASRLGDSVNAHSAVAFDAKGTMYIADPMNEAVLKVSTKGTLSVLAKGHLGLLEGIAVDRNGTVYVADKGSSIVRRITAAGVVSVFAGTGKTGAPTAGKATSSRLTYPDALAVDTAGNLYIADQGTGAGSNILRVTPSGVLSIVVKAGSKGVPLPWATGIAVDSKANLYVSDAQKRTVVKVTPAGVRTLVAGAGTTIAPKLDTPFGIVMDTSGVLYVAAGQKIVAITLTTKAATVVAGSGDYGAPTPGTATLSALSPDHLAVDAAGNVYATSGPSVVRLAG